MAPNRSKSLYAIKECSTCGSWYTKECCSIGNLNDQIIVPVSDSSLHCAVCGTPVDGPYCHGCTLIRMKFEKDLFTYCVDNGVFQNFQDTSESSNDNTNVVNAPREPSVVDQDPGVMKDFLKKYDHIPHNEKSIKLLLAKEKFLNIQAKLCGRRSNTHPEKDQEEKSIAELLAEERLQKTNQVLNESQSPQEIRIQDLEIQRQQCLEEIKEWMNDLGIREYQKEEIDIDYRWKEAKSLEESEAEASARWRTEGEIDLDILRSLTFLFGEDSGFLEDSMVQYGGRTSKMHTISLWSPIFSS
ncbi:hypothetical protein Tco_1007462 [Tanacetum coccineum]